MRTSLWFAALCVLSFGCSNDLKGIELDDSDTDTGLDTGIGTTEDGDNDGFPADEDCDDTDPNVFPDAPELCDGIDNDCDGQLMPEEEDADGNGIPDCQEDCDTIPGGGTVPMLPQCEYAPAPSGTPFLATVEWAMTQGGTDPATGNTIPRYTWAEYDGFGGAMQAPVVIQATDDNLDGSVDDEDTPDIAVVMGHPDEFEHGVLRLISGDGSRVHDSVMWAYHSNANGNHEYAPYHYAGVAIGNIDNDPFQEIATLVVRRSDNLCYPAYYEVRQSGNTVTLQLEAVYGGSNYNCGAHSPALADLESDGEIELIYGKAVFRPDFTQKWYGGGGRGWYGQLEYADGYWNSGYMSFAYDMDGDGRNMEVVAGSTVYNSNGTTYCELGEYIAGTFYPALDGYPAVADVLRFTGDSKGEPEIVLTGNDMVSIYKGIPDSNGKCVLVDEVPNAPEDDPSLASGLPNNPNCDGRRARGGPATIADFDGDGDKEVAVAGACWYTVYNFNSNRFNRYAMAQTLDWSSASTGSTVFDFNGDGAQEVVFSDEQAVYVWGVDTRSGLQPWDRLVPYLIDRNHKSWTIHEYPLVADVDQDGKAEILAVNSHNPDYPDHFGIYVLGAADDDWVSARPAWNQHAYHVTNLDSTDQLAGYCDPNYAPYTTENFNSFRQQEPGRFGALAASNLYAAVDTCQAGCGDITVFIRVANEGEFIATDGSVILSVYGETRSGQRTLLKDQPVGKYVFPGELTDAYPFTISNWSSYDRLIAVVDDPNLGPAGGDGAAKECDETDNEVVIDLSGFCP